ncbi:hypothetical protein ACWA06_11805 [Serratia rhizosphaerae]|uniref:Lipoprotein n=1 Tax=Serratia rhizosphaerae TaxID=2597702 RepID=A0ABX6GNC6_9GAMM|nr:MULTISPECIES: hypothetical protein [Serratia]MBU3893871.1 hypothetical protein [Serratia rubidaea]AVJ19407.1 hypothetical protein CLM71_20830 [Serratia sp. MYb239]MCA4825552.1 hypothetical protein [Serratia rubidaea]MEB6334230.1 hypothetical protein [Serratia rhizosphaerae]QHA87758.1 hypothetical protein FO014_12775 [Serratia rhizosphaerae]
MRWLFAMLIALLCWTGAVSGHQLYTMQPASSALQNAQPNDATAAQNDYLQALRPPADLRSKTPGKKWPLLLSRNPPCHSAPLSAVSPIPAYALTEARRESRYPRQAAPASNRLDQVNWMLRTSHQQSRVGGWKASNMLYRGTLTYHS